MPDDKNPKPLQRESTNYLLWNVASLDRKAITEEEIAYFAQHPDQIDEVSSPLILHRLFLWFGLIVGIAIVGLAKFLSFGDVLNFVPEGVEEFIVDIVFEMGVALIGAAIVTFMIGLTLNQQQARAKSWRKEMRRRIAAITPPTSNAGDSRG